MYFESPEAKSLWDLEVCVGGEGCGFLIKKQNKKTLLVTLQL